MPKIKQPRLALALWWLSWHTPPWPRRLGYWLNRQANRRGLIGEDE